MKSQTPKARAEESQAESRAQLEARLRSMKTPFDTALAEYAEALANGTFEDEAAEEEGSGEKRKAQLQKKITVIIERAKRLKTHLDSGERTTEETLKNFEDRPTIDYAAYAADVDASKAGEEWQLPESIQPNFETARPFMPDLSSFVGKPRHEVFQHVLDTYGATHCIPGREYLDWLAAHPKKTPPSLQDNTKWFYFPGSLVRVKDGVWSVPYARWNGAKWHRVADWLAGGWGSSFRVVLLEK